VLLVVVVQTGLAAMVLVEVLVQMAVVVQTGLAAMVLVEVLQLVARMELQTGARTRATAGYSETTKRHGYLI
jgi:hypothetical protein